MFTQIIFLCLFNLLFTYHTVKSLLHASYLQVFLLFSSYLKRMYSYTKTDKS